MDALRERFARGYGWGDFRCDLMSGIVVGVVALPLSMALAIASGVEPKYGLYTAIVAGSVIALLGGSQVQVSGPTAAFVVILAPIAAAHGLTGLLIASMLAGVMLILMGVARLGRFMEFVPYPVTAGFTCGIAIVIATLQLKDFLGLNIAGKMPEHYFEKVGVLFNHLWTFRLPDLGLGLGTLGLLVGLPYVFKRVPSPLIALPLAAVAALLLQNVDPNLGVSTIQSRFGGIPQMLPMPILPWAPPDSQAFEWSFDHVRDMMSAAFAIAMLGAIESLLSAVVSDGMAGTKHNPDSELVAQGIGNIAAPFFGGFAATGAIARTATNVRSGAQSPLAAVMHAVFVLAAVLALAPLLGYLPMAALAALLLLVAWRMSEIRHVIHTLRVAPRHDVLVLLTCLSLTVIFDMVVSVTVGVVLAALLFMQRMADLTGAQVISERHSEIGEPLPSGVLVYEVRGPLFFGAAQKAMSALASIGERGVSVVVLDLRSVPVMDATGLVSLESALGKLHQGKIFTIIAGVQRDPLHLMARAGWKDRREWLAIYASFEDGMALARMRSQAIQAHSVDAPTRTHIVPAGESVKHA